MPVPVLRQRSVLIASLRDPVDDAELHELADRLVAMLGGAERGVVIDLGNVSVVDSFAARLIQQTALACQLRGASTVVAGIRPEVAFAMVQLGLHLDVDTALDLDDALDRFDVAASRGPRG